MQSLRVALVFPSIDVSTIFMPTVDEFENEDIDFVLFPEEYVGMSDDNGIAMLKELAYDLNVPLLVGASRDIQDDVAQVLLRFNPDGSDPIQIYTKHSSAGVIAFEMPNWNARDMLPTFELGGVKTGATICHDHYLGLLQRHLAKNGDVRIWLNPSYDNVRDIKWSSVLRLRAVENRLFALCTLHDTLSRRAATHPFAFSPDGNELHARKAGSAHLRPISDCKESNAIYVVDLDISITYKPFDWVGLPRSIKQKVLNKNPVKPVRVSLRNARPAIYTNGHWNKNISDRRIQTDHDSVYVGVVPDQNILDAAVCFRIIYKAHELNCRPIIWNHWDSLPTESDRIANLLMGRVIECCTPIVISDKTGIHELVELSNANKIPVRRIVESSDTMVDIKRAWGLPSALKMATDNTENALDLYRSLID